MNDAIKDAPGKQVTIQDWGLSFDQVVSDLGHEADESTDEGLEDEQEKCVMSCARTYKAVTFYFDRDDEIIGREMSKKEIEPRSRTSTDITSKPSTERLKGVK
jgi:hypothetical protein